jgi:predicted nuclease with TOPRIM domain
MDYRKHLDQIGEKEDLQVQVIQLKGRLQQIQESLQAVIGELIQLDEAIDAELSHQVITRLKPQ